MLDVVVILAAVVIVVGGLAYGLFWLKAVGDLLWMAGLGRLRVLVCVLGVGLAIDLASLLAVPDDGLAAARLTLALAVTPLPARLLADLWAWWGLPKAERGPFRIGALFTLAFMARQAAFIQALGDAATRPDAAELSSPAAADDPSVSA